MRETKTKSLTIRLDTALDDLLRITAHDRGMTSAQLVRGILTNWMYPGKLKLLRNTRPQD